MTLSPQSHSSSENLLNLSFKGLCPAIVVRMSAIGDTLIAARTHTHLIEKGYAPFILTHKSNASLLNCMPLLRGACLLGENETSFWLRTSTGEALQQVDHGQFAAALHSSEVNAPPLNILDLQATRRSARAIQEFERLFKSQSLQTRISVVQKLTLWRLVLVLWALITLRQWHKRSPPPWLLRKLKPVPALQKDLVDKLPLQNARVTLPGRVHALTAPEPGHLTPSRDHIVFFVGASFRLKSWPREHFRTLLNLVLSHTNHPIILCGGRDDASVGDFLAFPSQPRVMNCIGKTTLAETLGIIRSARYVVTGDSFASHAADLLGVPASVIFGATHPLLGFAPLGEHTTIHHAGLSCSPCSRHGQGQCRYKNLKCLTLVTAEDVFSKMMHTLNFERQNPDTLRHRSDS